MSVVCTVTPAGRTGTVVSWYRSEISAELGEFMVSASRDGVVVGEHLMDGLVPDYVSDRAQYAHRLLHAGGSADVLVDWATHRREQTFAGTLVPIPEDGRPCRG